MADLYFNPVSKSDTLLTLSRDERRANVFSAEYKRARASIDDPEWCKINTNSYVRLSDVAYVPYYDYGICALLFHDGQHVFEQLVQHRENGRLPEHIKFSFNRLSKVLSVTNVETEEFVQLEGGPKCFFFIMREGEDDGILWPQEFLDHGYVISGKFDQVGKHGFQSSISRFRHRNIILFSDAERDGYIIPNAFVTNIDRGGKVYGIPSKPGVPVIRLVDESLETTDTARMSDCVATAHYISGRGGFSSSIHGWTYSENVFLEDGVITKYRNLGQFIQSMGNDGKKTAAGSAKAKRILGIEVEKTSFFGPSDTVLRNNAIVQNQVVRGLDTSFSPALHVTAMHKRTVSFSGGIGGLFFGISPDGNNFFHTPTDFVNEVKVPDTNPVHGNGFCFILSKEKRWFAIVGLPVLVPASRQNFRLREFINFWKESVESSRQYKNIRNLTVSPHHHPRYINAKIAFCMSMESGFTDISADRFTTLSQSTRDAISQSPGLAVFMANIQNTCKGFMTKIGRVLNTKKWNSQLRFTDKPYALCLEDNDMVNFAAFGRLDLWEYGLNNLLLKVTNDFDNMMIRINLAEFSLRDLVEEEDTDKKPSRRKLIV